MCPGMRKLSGNGTNHYNCYYYYYHYYHNNNYYYYYYYYYNNYYHNYYDYYDDYCYYYYSSCLPSFAFRPWLGGEWLFLVCLGVTRGL